MTITGGCLCGAVRYRIEAEPIAKRVCWCRDCQYVAAGNGTVNITFPSEAVHIAGELKDYTSRAASGNLMHRRFCPNCGTHVTTQSGARPHLMTIRVGTLDDREIARPAMTIWTKSAPSWAVINPRIPHDEGQPAPPVMPSKS
jgi:hypothetical protein